MNTASKRFSKLLSLIASYTSVLVFIIFASTVLLNRDTPQCTPTIHSNSKTCMVFTPNIDISKTINYNVKEAYIYLVHKTQENGVVVEQTVWSTLAKKEKTASLFEKAVAYTKNSKMPLTAGTYVLKGSYFPYIGIIKSKTFAEFSSTPSK
ncbi:signal peptidase complex subunit 3 [Nematocida major]|uniref:signal peptidase complex subunit 3 n=1 Tax=Nematocida major TaxID=1912982 RepID=UPI002007E460|nr:signal peptidase complex subunit 3 [Nematocida major]KAH9385795.1 signal peptidase complex subunit 3 [Nematocida major]